MEVRLIGDPILRKRAKKVNNFDNIIKELTEEMFSTMYLYEGVGLAAPQVGVSLRLFIMDSREENGKKVVINPEIIEFLGEDVSEEEGCLSIPEIFEDVVRPEGVKVKYQDLEGKLIEEELHGYQARIFQHENDHLDGILFTDKLSLLKKTRIKKELSNLTQKGKKRSQELGSQVRS